MKAYEALIIVKAAGTEQEMSRQSTGLEEPIKKVGGSVESNQHMGRRRLAFRIARQTEGHYFLLRFQAPTAQVGELDRLFRLNDAVVRFMILSADEVDGPAPDAEPSAPALAKIGSVPPPVRRR
ncbi:MAG: 30S ribosomal protein S6 [Candidatus Omnitrophica bacterium]|nr:30S ribosomal protein S6 [Candidatus Omnitrophota bacterium]